MALYIYSMQHACAILYLWPVQLCHIFQHYLINGTIFGKNVTEHKMCIFMFSTTLSATFLILWRIQRDIINKHWSSCKVAGDVAFWWNLNFLDRFWKNAQILNFVKIRSVGAEEFHAGGGTDMTKPIVAFRNFAMCMCISPILSQRSVLQA